MPQRASGASEFVAISSESLLCFPESRWPHPGCPQGTSPAWTDPSACTKPLLDVPESAEGSLYYQKSSAEIT